MKKKVTLTLLAISLMVLGMSPSANAGSRASKLDGRWVLTERHCTDGSVPTDRFVQGRDHSEITLSGRGYYAYSRSENEEHTSIGQLRVRGRYLVMIDSDGVTGQYVYALGLEDELFLYSAGFEDGGTCPRGEGIVVVLKKQ